MCGLWTIRSIYTTEARTTHPRSRSFLVLVTIKWGRVLPAWSWFNGPTPVTSNPLFLFFPLLLQGKFQPPAHWAFLPNSNVATFPGAVGRCCSLPVTTAACVVLGFWWSLLGSCSPHSSSTCTHTDSCHPIIPRNPLHHRLVSSV